MTFSTIKNLGGIFSPNQKDAQFEDGADRKKTNGSDDCGFKANKITVDKSGSNTAIRLERLTKKYKGQEAVGNVSFTVERGSVFALLGENGAGKTTTIKILLGMVRPNSGSAEVLGLDPIRDDVQIRKLVGYVPEQTTLYDWMTVEQIGRFASAFYPEGYWPEYCRLIDSFGLDLSAKIKNISKGMKAEVSLSLALASDPDLLILDEPTSGLDAMIRRKFLESMVDRAAVGKTVFLSSHQITEVERIADTVAIMKKSRILLIEPLEQLKATTTLFHVTFKESVPKDSRFGSDLFQTLVDRQTEGREIHLLGRYPVEDALERIQNTEGVAEAEQLPVTLEEIFVAYMR